MKLLTDEATDRESFKQDFDTACKAVVMALAGPRGEPPKSAVQVSTDAIEAVEESLRRHTRWLTIKADPTDLYSAVELEHAMQWLCLVIARWQEHHGELDQDSRNMFRLVGARASQMITGLKVHDPEGD
jgi:hypothetical protein